METEESVPVNPYNSQQFPRYRTVTKPRHSMAIALICVTLVAAAIGWGKGLADYSSMIDGRWRQAGYTDWLMDSSFQTKVDETCAGSAPNGCGGYMVVSKFDCSEVRGQMAFETEAGKTLEYVDARVANVKWGQPFLLQFNATPKADAATKINLLDLKCIR